jgi:hypothetical protein
MDCIEKQEPTLCCLQETHLAPKDNPKLNVKGFRARYQANGK